MKIAYTIRRFCPTEYSSLALLFVPVTTGRTLTYSQYTNQPKNTPAIAPGTISEMNPDDVSAGSG